MTVNIQFYGCLSYCELLSLIDFFLCWKSFGAFWNHWKLQEISQGNFSDTDIFVLFDRENFQGKFFSMDHCKGDITDVVT